MNEFTHLSDSIFTTNSHNIAAMQMRYETEKREKESNLLKSEINIQNLELEKSNLKNWLSTLSLVIVSIIGFFSYHRYNVKKKANVLLEKKIQGALQKQQEQQEIIFHQANLSSLGELSAGMAHEINQPLQGIKLATEALELDTRDICPENSNIKENIGEIYQGVERIKKIIDHVRVFASQQKNHIDEFFKTSTVIENALSLIGKQYLKSGIIVQTKLDSRIGQVKGNPYKYEQIVFNLLSNAKDAILEKEEKIKESIKKEIKIKTYRDESDIVLDVQDNGIGMTMEQKNSIFNPFFTTKKLGAGTGLGLSIVFGIVKEMSGKISVKSDYSVGTLIQVKIPCAKEKNTV
jgi:C4-dicarboxylate-specific signal transduction histidine kinase